MSNEDNSKKKEYNFGGIKEFNLEEIESEVLNDSVYLDVFAGSDMIFKDDVRPLENSLNKLLSLDGVSYNYKTEDFPEYNFSNQRQIGFIAQAVEKSFPELVRKDQQGHLSVNYAQLTPALVEGIKTLSKQVQNQAQEIEKLKESLENRNSTPQTSTDSKNTSKEV